MLNPRELAIVIWMFIFLLIILLKKDIRDSIGGMLEAIWKLTKYPIGSLIIIYTTSVFILLTVSGLVTMELLKDYLLWIFFGLIPLVGKVISSFRTVNIWRLIVDLFKFSVIPVFIINEYTLPFIAEFLLFPIVIFIFVIVAMSDTDPKLLPVKKLGNFLIATYGFVILYFAVTGFLKNITDAKDLVFWEKMFIEFLGIPFHLPLLILIRVLSYYEHILVRTDLKPGKEKLFGFFNVFVVCNFSISKLSKILEDNRLWRIKNINELKAVVKEI